MLFLNRTWELAELERSSRSREGSLVVLFGRRRIGKTRLLLEWVHRNHGIYFVADQSSSKLQRQYLARAVAARLPGFADVEYPDWRALFDRLSLDARRASFRGPLVIDELPYLMISSPELASVLQQWVDHGAKAAHLTLALAGSSQRMMHGLILDASAPLYGRARAVLDLSPLAPKWLSSAFPSFDAWQLLELWTAFGGVPRYWELAAEVRGKVEARVRALVLDPMGPLHLEPDRLLLEEVPTAVELRPLLDALGSGAHRISEIASRIGKPATSLARSMDRLIGLGLVKREVPFGAAPRESKRSLYRLADPFLRLWFRLIAPQRGFLASATATQRRKLLAESFPALIAASWEELSRASVVELGAKDVLDKNAAWLPAGRWWQGNAPEWEVISRTCDGEALLLGEARAWKRAATHSTVLHEVRLLNARSPPPLEHGREPKRIVRALFLPRVAAGVPRTVEGVRIVTLRELFDAKA
ncbi:MAG: ATP-binding protein [Myxococcaceae bacterium]